MSAWKLVLLGFLRHILGAFGAWLVTRGYLEPGAVSGWESQAVQEAFGAICIGLAFIWSAIDKQKVIAWIKAALHMPPQNQATEHVAARRISPLIAK